MLKTVLAEMTTYSTGKMFLHCRGLMRDNFAIEYYGLGDERNVLLCPRVRSKPRTRRRFRQLQIKKSFIFLNRKPNNHIVPTYNLLFLSIKIIICKVRIFYFLFNYVLFLCFLLKNIKFFIR